MKQPIRILLADDHAIVRTGLSFLLGEKEGFIVVGEASDGTEAVAKAVELKPDVVVMDLMMPVMDGATATSHIHDQLPETKVLILTSFGMANDLSKALANGAAGALLKNSAISELVGAIRAVVVDGKRVISPDIVLILASEPPIPDLSARQMQILDSIARGLSNEQIAEQYDLSLGSVKTHIEKLLAKIGAANRAEAAGIALRRHLLKT